MKQSTVVLLFCTLLFNTLTDGKDHSKTRHRLQKREKSCEEICKCQQQSGEDKTEESSLTINVKANILIVLNETSESAAVFDFKSSISGVFSTDSVTLFNYENGSGFYLPKGLFNNREDMEKFFKNLDNLNEISQQAQKDGTSFNVSSAPPEIVKKVAQILNSFGNQYSPSEALENFVHLSKSISEIFSALSKGLGKIISDLRTRYSGGLGRFLQTLQGLRSFFESVPELSNALNNINLPRLINQPSGLHLFINLLEQLASRGNLGQILGNRLNSPESFFQLLELLGGNSTEGSDGLIHVIAEITRLSQNNSNIQGLTHALLEYSSNPNNAQQFLSAIENLHKVTQQLNIPNLSKLIQDIRNNNWSSNGINWSQILSTLQHVDPQNPINSIVSILFTLRQRSAPEESIPELFEQLISRLNTTNGRHCVSHIFPNLNININAGLEDLLLPGFTIRNIILKGIEDFWNNMANFWSHIPIIGRFYEAIDRALGLATHGALQLNRLLENRVARPRVERILEFLRRLASRGESDSNESSSNSSNSGGILGHLVRPLFHHDQRENGHKERHYVKGHEKHNKQLENKEHGKHNKEMKNKKSHEKHQS